MENATCDIGLIGLAVMGQNLVLNMNDHGYKVAVFNRTTSKVDDFLANEAKGTQVVGAHSVAELIQALKRPRRVMLMVKAGETVDQMIDQVVPHLEKGDIVIDGGNSHFPDTNRRTKSLNEKGIWFIGTGVSGGEEGARFGPSIMPGGNPEAWPHVKDIFQSIAAKVEDGSPCCDWVGEGGAGHYVKMVHNGIEYAIMEAYAEGLDLLRHKKEFDLDLLQVSKIWQYGSVIRSWLLDLTVDALSKNPALEGIGAYVTDSGEGRWTVREGIDLGVPLPAISGALDARFRSQDPEPFANKLLAMMRHEFGGHAFKTAAKD